MPVTTPSNTEGPGIEQATMRRVMRRVIPFVFAATRWMRLFRSTGSVATLPKGGDLRSGRIEAFAAVILGAIEAHLAQRPVEHQTQRRRQDGDGDQPRDPTLMLRGRPTLQRGPTGSCTCLPATQHGLCARNGDGTE